MIQQEVSSHRSSVRTSLTQPSGGTSACLGTLFLSSVTEDDQQASSSGEVVIVFSEEDDRS
jgi:hypothetical protein